MAEWYMSLNKHWWFPPSYVFWIVWSFLYLLIWISYWYILSKYVKLEIKFKFIVPFIINLIANFSFSYIQFRLNNYMLAFIDILIIISTIIWIMKNVWNKYRIIWYMQIPYLLWCIFAWYLQLKILIYN